jgi:hypothetical protein
MAELSQPTTELIHKFAAAQRQQKPKEGVSTIHVDEVALKVAAFYERIRTIIDWKEEHLMRRSAIIRKLKRRFFDLELNNFSTENIAEPLVLEFIRGGFFPNDKIEESKISDVQHIIEKYIFILKNNSETKKGKAGLQFYTRLLEIAACEIEETLAPSIKEMALIEYMFAQMQQRIKVSDRIYEKGLLKKEDADVQIYIAVQQALFKLDDPIISYNLIKYKYSQWDNMSEDDLLKMSHNIYAILQDIEADLTHPLGKKFYAICEKYDTPYLLLGDILAKDDIAKTSEQVYDPATLEGLIKSAYVKRLVDLKAKISRAAIYSTISIFITKVLSLVIIEVIIEKIFGGSINLLALFIDILIPTLLMTFLVITVKPPSKKNLQLVVMETIKIVYQKETIDTYEIKAKRRRSFFMRAILSLIYVAGAVVSFGVILWAFNLLDFSITSMVIDIIFIALILFAGTAIRARSRELSIEEESEGFLGFISDILLLPITGIGRFLSNTWKQYNAITALFNALIDMPFSAFVEFIEGWRYFIKDQKEDMR